MPKPMQQQALTAARIEQALDARREQAEARAGQASRGLPDALRAAYEDAIAFARAQEETAAQRLDADRPALAALVQETQDRSLPPESRMARLRTLAERLNQAVQSLSACAASHCSHCCYTPVRISELEARMIGDALGIAPQAPPTAEQAAALRPRMGHAYDWPCPFLVEDAGLAPGKGGRCGIYAHRPMVCRGCLSMAPSDALCALQPDHLAPIPLFDARVLHLLAAQIGGAEVADIRDFFPSGLAAGMRA